MKYLLDTAVWINAVTMPEVLPARIRQLLKANEPKGLCSVSLLETAILHRLGRLEFAGTLDDLFAAGISADLHLIELTAAVAVRTNALPKDFQGDPFDRTIAATAAVLNLTLISPDPIIRNAKVCDVVHYPFKPRRSKARPK